MHLLGEQLRGGKMLQGISHSDLKAALLPKYGDDLMDLGHLSLF